ncbi:thiamine phosphate synthase [Paenibacillus sp. IITD108]|uniref:thiamine phosphate synthase n=1 Tax=Paenibacillus sp. IITD108 TaxID=3116649 RepID=UPI002F42F1BA
MNKDKLDFKLYAITSGEAHKDGRTMLQVMEQAIKGGADIVQLRNKSGDKELILQQAKALRTLTRSYRVPFIVNDDPHMAKLAEADGVHLGQEDMPIDQARVLLGSDAIVGISTHSLQQALAAEQAGADYIGVGPVFETPTKPGRPAVSTRLIEEVASSIRIPFVAIGGITLANAAEVLAAGAARLCAVRAITDSAEPEQACRRLCELIHASRKLREINSFPINILLNGKLKETYAASVSELLDQLGQQHKIKHLIVELDGCLLPRTAWNERLLKNNSHVELIQFVGGG